MTETTSEIKSVEPDKKLIVPSTAAVSDFVVPDKIVDAPALYRPNMKSHIITLYGDPATRKTTIAARLADKRICFLIDEGGYAAIEGYPELWRKVAMLRVFKSMNDFHTLMYKVETGKFNFDTLIVDTVSGISKLSGETYRQPFLDPEETIKNPNYLNIERIHRDIPARGDWFAIQNSWNRAVSLLATQTNFRVIFISHPKGPDPSSGRRRTMPDLYKGVYNPIHGKSAVVGYTDLDSKGRGIVTTQTNGLVVGKQLGVFNLKPTVTDDEFVDKVRARWGLPYQEFTP